MTVIVIGNHERILYYNVTQIIDEAEKLVLLGDDERDLQIVINYNCHTIGTVPMVTIEKSNIVTNEIYIDDDLGTNFQYLRAKCNLNSVYGKMVTKYIDTDSVKEEPEDGK